MIACVKKGLEKDDWKKKTRGSSRYRDGKGNARIQNGLLSDGAPKAHAGRSSRTLTVKTRPETPAERVWFLAAFALRKTGRLRYPRRTPSEYGLIKKGATFARVRSFDIHDIQNHHGPSINPISCPAARERAAESACYSRKPQHVVD